MGKVVNQAEYDSMVLEENKSTIKDFLIEKKAQGKAKGTIEQYAGDLKIIAYINYKEFGNKSFTELTRKDIRNISIYFQEQNLSNARVNRLISTLRSTLEVCADDDDYQYDANVGSRVKGLPRKPVREITFLSDVQINWLKSQLIKRKEWLKVMYLMVSYTSAARKNEVHQVLKANLAKRYFTNTVVGKGSKKFRLFYTPEVQDLIRKYLDERGQDDLPQLFVKVYKNGVRTALTDDAFSYWCGYFGKLLSMKEGRFIHVNPHCLRHSRLENLSRQGIPIEKLKSLAHHEDISTTASYLADSEEDDIAEIFGMNPEDFAV